MEPRVILEKATIVRDTRGAADALAPAPPAACLNCGVPLAGPFCSACGQRDVPPYPTVRELVVDAFWELSGWDGRFASTVRALFRRPGMLTREFLEGRRARYISPLRLYLMSSLLYFLVAAAAPDLKARVEITAGGAVRVTDGTSTLSRPQRVANAAAGSLEGNTALTAEERREALREVEAAPALMRPFLRRAIEDPARLKRGIVEAMPRMLFALLPVLAGIIALFYRGRRYPEHLYFAIHLGAFLFLAFTVAKLGQFTNSVAVATALAVPVTLSIPVYATLAFRRVYGGGLAATVAKEAAIAVLYAAASLAAFVCVIYFVALFG